jgi:hypothetical protein
MQNLALPYEYFQHGCKVDRAKPVPLPNPSPMTSPIVNTFEFWIRHWQSNEPMTPHAYFGILKVTDYYTYKTIKIHVLLQKFIRYSLRVHKLCSFFIWISHRFAFHIQLIPCWCNISIYAQFLKVTGLALSTLGIINQSKSIAQCPLMPMHAHAHGPQWPCPTPSPEASFFWSWIVIKVPKVPKPQIVRLRLNQQIV